MPHLLRRLLGNTRYYADWKALGHYPDYWWWNLRGKPPRSPHLVKQRTVIEYARRFGLHALIETGTYYGEMVAATLDYFQAIYSIELDARLASLAQQRFRKFPQVHIVQGDSQQWIPKLLAQINRPCLFWLDAGYYGWDRQSGNKGRMSSELRAILSHFVSGHVILMDDARGLNGQNGAPTVDELKEAIEREFPGRSVEVRADIVRIHCTADSSLRSE
jgi:hypothetical protein